MYGIQVFELPIRHPHRDDVWTFGYRSLNFQGEVRAGCFELVNHHTCMMFKAQGCRDYLTSICRYREDMVLGPSRFSADTLTSSAGMEKEPGERLRKSDQEYDL